jgi:hypothetical protein
MSFDALLLSGPFANEFVISFHSSGFLSAYTAHMLACAKEMLNFNLIMLSLTRHGRIMLISFLLSLFLQCCAMIFVWSRKIRVWRQVRRHCSSADHLKAIPSRKSSGKRWVWRGCCLIDKLKSTWIVRRTASGSTWTTFGVATIDCESSTAVTYWLTACKPSTRASTSAWRPTWWRARRAHRPNWPFKVSIMTEEAPITQTPRKKQYNNI